MQLSVYNINGEKVGSRELPDSICKVEMNEGVLHTVYKAYRANRRQGTHATKTRSMVSGGGKKPFKQKGTGNARQGSTSSPLQYGGGVSHGPQPRDYRQRVNKKVRKLALRMMLSERARSGRIVLVDDFDIKSYKTQQVVAMIDTFKKKIKGFGECKKVLMADERKDDFLLRSARNIKGVEAVTSSDINVGHLLSNDTLLLSETALQALGQKFGGGTNEPV